MALHIIIDAYNFIHHAPFLDPDGPGGLEAARDELVDLLASYKKVRPAARSSPLLWWRRMIAFAAMVPAPCPSPFI
ncbi:MAG: NYN domain-containing protein [Deltaproteobacteria bacterium]|nr:NYN domain-containing protein [Deltaproteobacteria bacterium]